IKKATELIGVAGPGSYQETNPAVSYQGEWRMVLSPDASGGTTRVASDAGDVATISFRGGAIHLLTRKGPDAPTVYVTLDGREANRLPRDRQGRSYVDLYSATPQPRVLVAIAQELPSRDHVLRIPIGPPNPNARETALALAGF